MYVFALFIYVLLAHAMPSPFTYMRHRHGVASYMCTWPMAISLFPLFLPIPLVVAYEIGCHCATLDLLSLLLASTRVNKLLTPLLYKHIDLDSWDAILKLLQSLTRPASDWVFARDRLALVLTLALHEPSTRRPFYASKDVVSACLFASLPRMINLQHLVCTIGLINSSDVLYVLTTSTFRSLRSINLYVCTEISSALKNKSLSEVKAFRPAQSRNLHTVKLAIPHWSTPAQKIFVRNLILSCAGSLRVLALTSAGASCRADDWASILPTHGDFSSLVNLALESQALTHPFVGQVATAVRSLTILDGPSSPPVLPSGALPQLRELCCPPSMLAVFLAEQTSHSRPISSVSLSNSPITDDGIALLLQKWPPRNLPSARRVLEALAHLQHSAVPVARLGFAVSAVSVEALARARAHLTSLEELTVAVRDGHNVVNLSFVIPI